MNVIQLQNHISIEQYQMAIRVLNAIGIKTKTTSLENEEKDDAEMTKEAYFAMIDQARKGKKHRINREDMRKMLLENE